MSMSCSSPKNAGFCESVVRDRRVFCGRNL